MRTNTEWLRSAGWGVFARYLATPEMTAEDWNQQVDAFDVDGLADQLQSVRAPYFMISVGQNSGHYLAPNATYDELVGIRPSKCARRDLIADLHTALAPHGIALLVYLPSNAPSQDPQAMQKLKWHWGYTPSGEKTGDRQAEFQVMWEAVVRDWSLRWGTDIAGWWVDGCYFAESMYRHRDQPNFVSFAAAIRAGNSHAIVAFNPGVRNPVVSHTPEEDFTAGEITTELPTAVTPKVDGAQWHVLTHLGAEWGQGAPRFPDSLVVGYTQHVVKRGGAVTWEAPVRPSGLIGQPFVNQLSALNSAMRGPRP